MNLRSSFILSTSHCCNARPDKGPRIAAPLFLYKDKGATLIANNSRFAFLDGIRGMAAIFIIARHTDGYWHSISYRSYLAVDIFFLLSGFVIAHAYEEKLATNRISVLDFILIRLIRFYPVFLISLFISFVVAVADLNSGGSTQYANTHEIWYALILTAFFIPSHAWKSNSLFPLNGPYWSLAFELLVNIMYGIFRPVLSNKVIVAIVIISGLWMTNAVMFDESLSAGFSWGAWSLLTGLARSLYGIFLGILLYRFRDSLLTANSTFLSWTCVAIIAAILSSPDLGRYNILIDMVSVMIIFPVAILVASRTAPQKFDRILLALGSASYPVYLLHEPVGRLISNLSPETIKAHAPLSGIIFVVFIVIFAYWMENRIDTPLRRKIMAFVFKPRSVAHTTLK